MSKNTAHWMRYAAESASHGVCLNHGGPFGACVVKDNELISVEHNTVLRDCDPSAHAEVNALRSAGRRLKTPHLKGCVVYTTVEPCPMCLAACFWARVDAVYYALTQHDAARYGFDDALFYEQLNLPPEAREMPLIRVDTDQKISEAVFQQWQSLNGQLY